MTYEQFTYWLRGYLTSQTDSQMKIDIEKALNQIGESKQPPLNVPLKSTPWSSPDTNPSPYLPYWSATRIPAPPINTCTTFPADTSKKEVLND